MSLDKCMQNFEKICQQNGLRVTHQRMQIYQTLILDSGHPSAEEIYAKVSQDIPMISLDTVYRTIAMFEAHGIIQRVQLLDDKARFDVNLKTHHHMICRKCKAVEDFYWPEFDKLEAPVESESWGHVNSKHAELWGICKKCRQK